MSNFMDVERQFRYLHNEAVGRYEEKHTYLLEQQKRQEDLQQRRKEQIRSIIHALQLDEAHFEHLAQEDGTALQNFLRDVRPALARSSVPRAEDAKRFALSPIFQAPNHQIVPVYGATLLASNSAYLEGNPGEQGNPWILPESPDQVRIWASDTGVGWGCAANPKPEPRYPDASATFWYYFVPDNYGTWNLTAFTTFHGFYSLKARSDFFSCEECRAQMSVTMNVYQDGNWHTPANFSLLDIDKGGIDKGSIDDEALRYDQPGSFDYQIGLAKGDPAWIMVTINLHTFANGAGSYSEINFSAGTGNFIQAGIVAAFLLS